MIKSRFSHFSIVMTGFLVVSCSQGTDASNAVVEAINSEKTDANVETSSSYADVERLIKAGERNAAVEMIDVLIAEQDAQTLVDQLNAYWSPNSTTRNEAVAVALAERITDQFPNAITPAYISGLAYDVGVSVEPDFGKVIFYWDRPGVHPIPSAQVRLAEIYGDADGDYYDAEKAREALERADDGS